MNAFQKKITLRVLAIHAAIIFLVAVVPLMRGCFVPKPKEIVTFIEFGEAAPAVSVQQVAKMTEPEPTPPAPEPEPAPIPEPVKKKPEPIKKKPEPIKKKPEPKKTKPKKRLARPEDIKIGPKVKETPTKPTVSSKEIQKALSGITSAPSGATGNPSQFNDYYGRVMRLFYNHWKPPSTASSATGSTVVRISMRTNGQITKRAKIKGSGDSLYDKTVMDAVNAVGAIPGPPANYPYDYVEVVFTLEN